MLRDCTNNPKAEPNYIDKTEQRMRTQREKEEFKKAELVAETYNNIEDMFDDLKSKLELYANLSLDNPTLSYSLAMYSDDLKVLVKAIQQKIH